MNKSSSTPVLEALESRLAPAGIVMLDVSGGVLTVTGDGDANNIQITETSPGNWNVSDGGGSGTLFSLNGGAALSSVDFAAANKINATLGSGDDTLSLAGTDVSGAVKVNGGDGADTFNTTDVTLGGNLALTLGDGTDTVNLGAGSYRHVNANLGTGSSVFNLTGAAVGINGNLVVTNAGGVGDTASFAIGNGDTDVTGSVKIQSSAETSTIAINDGAASGPQSLTVGGNLSLITGAGNDEINLAHDITAGGRINLHMGDGDNNIYGFAVNDLSAGSFSFKGGEGVDYISIDGNSVAIAGDMSIQVGNGLYNDINFNPAGSLSIGGNLVYRGGTGFDGFHVSGLETEIGGSLRFIGGGNEDQLNFGSETASAGAVDVRIDAGNVNLGSEYHPDATLTVNGPVSIRLGAAGQNGVAIYNADILNDLTVVNKSGIGADIRMIHSAVHGSTRIHSTGPGSTNVGIAGSVFDGLVTIRTGAGEDAVTMHAEYNSEGDTWRINEFNGGLKVHLGDGNDYFQSGGSSIAEPASYFSSLILNGGNGYDTAEFLTGYGNTFGSTPVVTHFESVS